MKKLLQGLREFKTSYFVSHQELFEQLSQGQKPRVLFITCSDSRIDPNLITQAGPGELFVIRNAGNIVPPYGATNGGEGASIEYAVQALDIQHIVVCGHSHCGAMKGLLKLDSLRSEMPLVHDWLKYAEATRRLVMDNYGTYSGEELLEIAIAENVLTQLENLRTYPAIHSKLYRNELNLYAWIFIIETGEVLAYDEDSHAYVLPHSQLPASERDEILTNAFPACDALIRATKTQRPAVANAKDLPTTKASPTKASSTKDSSTRDLPTKDSVKQPVAGQHRFPTTRLSPEQMERIYRGSAAR